MSSPAIPRGPRKFLVVIDKTRESAVALRFATRRAQHTGGRVILLCAATLPDFQQWRGVEEIMRDEDYAQAETLVLDAAKVVNDLAGIVPALVISKILVGVAVAIVFLVLCLGLYTLWRGGDTARTWSNKLMRIRVLAQAVAIVIIMTVLYLSQ